VSPKDPSLHVRTVCNPLPWVWESDFWWIECSKSDGESLNINMEFKIITSYWLTLPPPPHSLSFSVWWSQLPCCELPCGEAHLARYWAQLLAKSPLGMRPSIRHCSATVKLKQILPRWTLRWQYPTQHLDLILQSPGPEDLAEPHLDADCSKLWDNAWCCFKTVSYGQ
jgi:hypothetical protein